MPKLYNQKTDTLICDLSDSWLQFLIDQLEEEDSKDQDYYINGDTLTMLREANGDPDLLGHIEKAMGESGEVDVVWK